MTRVNVLFCKVVTTHPESPTNPEIIKFADGKKKNQFDKKYAIKDQINYILYLCL